MTQDNKNDVKQNDASKCKVDKEVIKEKMAEKEKLISDKKIIDK